MMKPPTYTRLFVLLCSVLLLATACGRNSQTDPTPTADSISLPSAEPTETPTNTAEPDATTPEPVDNGANTDTDGAIVLPTAEPDTSTPDTPEPEPAPVIDADWTPQLVYSSPAPGEETMLDGAITLRFDQAMDQASVEAAFEIDDEIAGEFMWTRPDTVIFTPLANLARDEQINVRLAETARGVNGKSLREALALNFETVGFLEVSQIVPDAGSIEIDVDSAITVFFNRPVVPLVSTAQQADLPNPLVITPSVEGNGAWIGTSMYRFQPTALAGATNYQVTVAAGLTDVTGGVLAEAVSAEFQTEFPKITAFSVPDVSDRPVYIRPTDAVSLTFNMPMDQAATESVISIDGISNLQFNWQDGGRAVGISSSEFALDNTYTLIIGEGARGISGNGSVATSRLPFKTYPFPSLDLSATRPQPGSVIDEFRTAYFGSANIAFVSPMNWDTIRDQITVTPEPSFLRYQFYNSETAFGLQMDVEYETDYTITIPATAEDVFGNQLGAPVTIDFTTSPAPLLSAFNLPGRMVQMSSAFPSNVLQVRRNLPAATTFLDQFVGNFPAQTLLGAAGGTDFPNGILIFDGDTIETIKTYQYDAIEGRDEELLLLNDGAALPNGVYNLWTNLPDLDSETKQRYGWQNRDAMLIVADTNLVLKETPAFVYVWATDLATGQPAPGRNVVFYSNYVGFDPAVPFAETVTDENGLGRIAKSRGVAWYETNGQIIAVTGEMGSAEFGVATTTQHNSVEQYQLGVAVGYGRETEPTAFVYTERPLYRPGDTVYIRGWLRDSNFGRYELPSQSTINLAVNSADFEQSQPDFATVEVDQNGNFSAELTLPADAALGGWGISLADKQYEGHAYAPFTVAEFRKPEFTIDVTASISETLRDEVVAFDVSAEYLFGGSAADLDLNWSLTATPFVPKREGPYFSFSSSENRRQGLGGFYGQYVDGGQGTLDENGRFRLTVTPDMLRTVEEGSVTLTLEASVKGLGDGFISTVGSTVLHSAETYVGVRPANYINQPNSDVAVELISTNWGGATVPNAPVEVVFSERRYDVVPNQFPGEAVQWEPTDSEVTRSTVTTDAAGGTTASFTPTAPGIYVATATVTDAAGRTQRSQTVFYVFGSGANWRFDATDRSMELTADADSYRVGETAQVLVQNPFDVPTEAWLTIERGDVLEERAITLPAGGGLVEVALTAEHAPNVFVTIAAVKPIGDSERPWADIRYGVVELVVEPTQFAFDLSISTTADRYAPRDTVTYEIMTTDAAGNPVSADVALALVDLAVLSLKEDKDTLPEMLLTFYERVPLYSRIGSGLFNSAEGLDAAVDDTPPGGFGGGGGGGGFANTATDFDLDRAQSTDADGEVRNDFRDTALWEAIVTTDENGRASVAVTLPDNLTTWRMTGRGMTASTLVGEATYDVVATKPLLIRPITPRFFTVGDRVSLGAVVNNNTDAAVEATALLEASGVEFGESSAEQTITIPANGSTLVRWPVAVADVDAVDLTFRVSAGTLSDASKPTVSQGAPLPVYRYNAQDTVAAAGVLAATDDRRVEAVLLPDLLDDEAGTLTLNLSPSLAATLFDSLTAYTERDDVFYSCPFGISLRLLANTSTLRAIQSLGLDEPTLTAQLEPLTVTQVGELLALAAPAGGWGWCGGAVDPYISAIAMHALLNADGVDSMPQETLLAGLRVVAEDAERIDPTAEGGAADRAAYQLYVLSLASPSPTLAQPNLSEALDALLATGRSFLSPSGLALVQMAYDNVGQAPPDFIASDLANAAILSATGAHWQGGSRSNFGSDVRATAIVIQALSQTEPDSPLLPNAVRWLMTARSGRYWPGPVDTAWAIAAANRYMLATGELAGEYAYTVRVNGGIQVDGGFSSDTIATSEQVSVPLADLTSADLNFIDMSKVGDGSLYYTAYLDAFVAADSVQPVDRGFYVARAFYDAACDAATTVCEPVTSVAAGEEVRVELTIVVPENRRFVEIAAPLPAGADAIDPNLDTSKRDAFAGQVPQDAAGYWGWWLFERIEFRDQKVVFIADFLPSGTYQYTFNMQAIVPGTYQVMPVHAQESAHPEVFGRSDGLTFTIAP